MSGNKFLIDTSIVIDVLKNKVEVATRINELEMFSINAIVYGELLTGVHGSINQVKQLAAINTFIGNSKVFQIDSRTADYFGQLYTMLQRKGKLIPSNDIWIAASAKQHGLTLITKDKHFAEVKGLDVEFW